MAHLAGTLLRLPERAGPPSVSCRYGQASRNVIAIAVRNRSILTEVHMLDTYDCSMVSGRMIDHMFSWRW